MSRADFIHEIKSVQGRNVIVITDLELGSIPVLEDIENVVADIALMEKIDPGQFMIVFDCSLKLWNGWDHANNKKVLLSEDTWWDAVSKYIQLQIN